MAKTPTQRSRNRAWARGYNETTDSSPTSAKGKRAVNVDSPSTAKDPAVRYFSSHGVQRHT